jgi:DNA-binding response OmpR family regulator
MWMSDNFRLLLAEDDPGDAGLVMAAIADSRFLCEVSHAKDGVEAMDAMRAQLPDLVLLDLNMPRKSGHEVLQEMRADPKLQGVPVVVLTTSDVERDVVSSWQCGCDGFVTKPVDVDELFRAVRGIQEYWFGLVRRPRR